MGRRLKKTEEVMAIEIEKGKNGAAIGYYLTDAGRVAGVLFWDGSPDLEAAKDVIGENFYA